MPSLFDPLTLRGLTLSNRILVSPMCEYSSVDGFANDWHFVHLGSRAVGGAAVVFTEATAVTPEGRISPEDLGIWRTTHIEGLARCVNFIHDHGRLAGIQLAHAGRKGSTRRPWEPPGAVPLDQGGWQPVGPSAERVCRGLPGSARASPRRASPPSFRPSATPHAARSTPASTSPKSTRRTAI